MTLPMQTAVSTAGGALALNVAHAQPVEPDDLQPGEKAGPWIVERELGRGGMGSVYAVVHEEIGKRAALKVMHRRLVTSSSAERILLEARVVNQVGHPNIVDIFETGTLPDGRPYIVMERLEGVPLSYRADDGKILPDQVIGILLQVCDALIAAHAANVVHRDLKLDNIFLIDNPENPSQPRVKLLDWGIAKIISADVRHTIEGQLVGTPQYLSPEQARGAIVSPQTDVYSLGVMAYELFLEQLPFEAETSAEIMAMHLRATPPPPSEMWPDIPPGLENLLLAMLAKDPDARPTMLTVAHTLELLRSELELRRHESGSYEAAPARPATIAPEGRRSASRWSVAPEGLAPTQPADAWLDQHGASRRWHILVGALAIAASAMMFVITRETEKAEAASQRAAVVEEASVPEVTTVNTDVRGTARELATPAATGVASKTVNDPIAPNEPTDPVVQPEPAPVTAVNATEEPVTPIVKKHKRASHRPRARRAQVKPRLDQPLDPDGTLDPYR